MTELSLATEADIPEILSLAEEMYNWSVYSDTGPFDKEACTKNLQYFSSDVNRFTVILLRENGALIGVLAATSFIPVFSSAKTGIEVFFYIKPEKRSAGSLKKLLSAYRYWCRRIGCKFYYVSKMVSSDEVEINKLRRI